MSEVGVNYSKLFTRLFSGAKRILFNMNELNNVCSIFNDKYNDIPNVLKQFCVNHGYNIKVELHIAEYMDICEQMVPQRQQMLLKAYPMKEFDQNMIASDDAIIQLLKQTCEYFEYKYIEHDILRIYYDEITNKIIILNFKSENFNIKNYISVHNISDEITEYVDDGGILVHTLGNDAIEDEAATSKDCLDTIEGKVVTEEHTAIEGESETYTETTESIKSSNTNENIVLVNENDNKNANDGTVLFLENFQSGAESQDSLSNEFVFVSNPTDEDITDDDEKDDILMDKTLSNEHEQEQPIENDDNNDNNDNKDDSNNNYDDNDSDINDVSTENDEKSQNIVCDSGSLSMRSMKSMSISPISSMSSMTPPSNLRLNSGNNGDNNSGIFDIDIPNIVNSPTLSDDFRCNYNDDGVMDIPTRLNNIVNTVRNVSRLSKNDYMFNVCNFSVRTRIKDNLLDKRKIRLDNDIHYKYEQIYIPHNKHNIIYSELKCFLGNKLPHLLSLIYQYQMQSLIGLIQDLYTLSQKTVYNGYQVWGLSIKDINGNDKLLYVVNKRNKDNHNNRNNCRRKPIVRRMAWVFDSMGSKHEILNKYKWNRIPNIIPYNMKPLCHDTPVWYSKFNFVATKSAQKAKDIEKINKLKENWDNIVCILPYIYKTPSPNRRLCTKNAELIFIFKDIIAITLLQNGEYKVVRYYKINEHELNNLYYKLNNNNSNDIYLNERELKVLKYFSDVLKICGLYVLTVNNIQIDVNINVDDAMSEIVL